MSIVWVLLYFVFSGIGAMYLRKGIAELAVVPLLTATIVLVPLAIEGDSGTILAAMLFTMAALPLWLLYWHLSEPDTDQE